MINYVRPALTTLLALFCVSAFTFLPNYKAPKPVSPPQPSESGINFIANKGQWDGPALFRANLSQGHLWLEQKAWVYHFWELPTYIQRHAMPRYFGMGQFNQSDSTTRGHVLKVHFKGAMDSEIIPEHKLSSYTNYFQGKDKSKWKGGVPGYSLLQYKELWPGIGMRVYSYGDAIKYDFIVEPGADPSQIQLRFEGADELRIEDEKLIVKTSVRTLTELPPVAYQEYGEGREGIACHFDLSSNTLGFSLPNSYDKDRPLIIDPTLVFSTFTGSTDDEWGFTAAYDTAGNMYTGGTLWSAVGGTPGSTTGYPTTPGAYSNVTQGGTFEITLCKFDPTGANLLYATLFGGADDDRPHSLIINDAGELFVYGRTLSNNFPTENAFDSTHNGASDIFVAKFNPTGTQLLASTYVGGLADDGINENSTFFAGLVTKYNYGDDARGEVMLDKTGNVYIASCTNSTDFPADSNAFQPQKGTGQDGVVFKMSNDLDTLYWSSFLGGNGTDAAYGIIVDSTERVIVTGGTNSNNIFQAGLTGGRWPAFRGGQADGFVVRIDSLGQNQLNGTYIGTTGYDQTFFVRTDPGGNIYLTGQTESTAFTIANVLYWDAGAKQFIIKLTPDFSTIMYSTTYGDPNSNVPNISPTAMLVDDCENVYVTGWGGVTNYQGNTNNMPITQDAEQSTTDGSDFYLFVLARDGDSVLYATYLGGNNPGGFSGEHVDGGTARFDPRGVVYQAVCANCGGITVPGTTPGPSFPATVGAYSTTNNSTNCNLAAFKFDFSLTGINANFIPLDTNNNPIQGNTLSGCPPLTINFDNTSRPSTSTRYFWEFGITGAQDTAFEPTFTFANPGTYTIRLIIEDSTSCNIRDTALQTIVVYPYPQLEAGQDEIICQGDSVTLEATGQGAVIWEPAAFTQNPTNPITAVFPPGNTNFIATLTDMNGCSIRDTLTVQVDSANWLSISPGDTSVCAGTELRLNAFAPNNSNYFWEGDTPLDDPRIASPTATLDSTRNFLVTVVDTNNCVASDSLEVIVYHSSAGGDTAICVGGTTELFAIGGASYQWEPAALADDPAAARPNVTIPRTTMFTAFVTLPNGCVDTHFVEVQALALPVLELSEPDSICEGESSILEITGGVSYTWSPGVFLDDSTANRVVANVPFSTTFTITATTNDGCLADTSLELYIRPAPNVDAGPDRSVCGEASTSLLGSGARDYLWSPGFGLDDPTRRNPVVRLLGLEQTYYLLGTDQYGCTATDSATVRVIEQPRTNIVTELFLCDPESRATVTALGGERIRWNDGSTNRTRIITPIAGGTVLIATASIDDCAGIPDTVVINQRDPFPVADFTADPVSGFAPVDVQFENLSERAVRYEWYFGEGLGQSQRENPLWGYVAGEWRAMLIAYSSENCTDTAYLDLSFENTSIHIPTAFSPNNDNVNDFFYIASYGIQQLNVRIYNRWGREVFVSDQPDFRWDGRSAGGEHVPEGVYVYQIDIVGPNGGRYSRTGTITVLR